MSSRKLLCTNICVFPTLRTNVLSLSGISSGMVVRTSTMADKGMLTLGFEDYNIQTDAY